MSDLFIAEFKGTYRAPSPDGIRDQNVTKPFHVKVKMKRECLKAPGLNGLFSTYYKEFLRNIYPDMIDTYMYDLVQATELDGTIINNPRALSYENLLKFISSERLPINVGLYPPNELRNQVILYQEDPKGQKHLEEKLQALKGNMLAISAELQSLNDVIAVVEEEDSEMEDLLATAGKGRTKKK
jgi:hypothetical protein